MNDNWETEQEEPLNLSLRTPVEKDKYYRGEELIRDNKISKINNKGPTENTTRDRCYQSKYLHIDKMEVHLDVHRFAQQNEPVIKKGPCNPKISKHAFIIYEYIFELELKEKLIDEILNLELKRIHNMTLEYNRIQYPFQYPGLARVETDRNIDLTHEKNFQQIDNDLLSELLHHLKNGEPIISKEVVIIRKLERLESSIHAKLQTLASIATLPTIADMETVKLSNDIKQLNAMNIYMRDEVNEIENKYHAENRAEAQQQAFTNTGQ